MTNAAVAARTQKAKRKSVWAQTMKRLASDKVAMFGLIGFIVLVLLCVIGPYLTGYDVGEMDFLNLKSSPSAEHWFGTDELGRDYLTRCLYGGRYSLLLGVCSSIAATIIGVIIGSIAGYYGGLADTIIMRLCDIIQSIPPMVVSIVVSLVLGSGYVVTIVALAIGGVSFSVRLTRGQVLSVRTLEYLDAAKLINASPVRIMFKHILPNVISPMMLDCTMKIAQMIQLSAGLSLIGLGVQVSTPEWGAMLSNSLNDMQNHPSLVLFPGCFIFVTTLFINTFGDGLRDAMDPKLKK